MARRPGSINKRTKERLAELRRKMALGYNDMEICDQMALTPKEWRNLLQRHYEGAAFEGTIYYWANFRARKVFQYQELVRALQSARGQDNPRFDPKKAPAEPRFLEKPRATEVVACVRGMAALDQESAEMGLRLGVLTSMPAEGEGAEGSGWRLDNPDTWSSVQIAEFLKTGALPTGPERRRAQQPSGGNGAGSKNEADEGGSTGHNL